MGALASVLIVSCLVFIPTVSKADVGCVTIKWSNSCQTCAMEGEIYCIVCDGVASVN
jgi:hypothetical protein